MLDKIMYFFGSFLVLVILIMVVIIIEETCQTIYDKSKKQKATTLKDIE